MRHIMFSAVALALIATAVSGSLLATEKLKADAAAMDIKQLTLDAKNLPVNQVNEPF